MKKFQSLNDPLFNNKDMEAGLLRKVYGGALLATTIPSQGMDCATHTAGNGSGHNNDGCDQTTDQLPDPK